MGGGEGWKGRREGRGWKKKREEEAGQLGERGKKARQLGKYGEVNCGNIKKKRTKCINHIQWHYESRKA